MRILNGEDHATEVHFLKKRCFFIYSRARRVPAPVSGGGPRRLNSWLSWKRSILTEVYLCHACSDPEIGARVGAGGPADDRVVAGGGGGGGRRGISLRFPLWFRRFIIMIRTDEQKCRGILVTALVLIMMIYWVAVPEAVRARRVNRRRRRGSRRRPPRRACRHRSPSMARSCCAGSSRPRRRRLWRR
eukprot:COSAG01_NODE_3393_length_6149_cov_24.742149_1_plen_188_part_00